MRTHEKQGLHNSSSRRHSIRTRLRWSYFISSTLPLILVGLLLIVINFRAQRERVYNEQIALAQQGVRQVSSYMSGIETQLLSVGQNMEANTSSKEWEDALRKVIDVQFPNIREVSVFDMDGIQRARLTLEESHPSDVPELSLSSDDPMIDMALQGVGQRSDIFLSDRDKPVFVVALPLRNVKRQSVGVIRAEISAIPLSQSLRLLGRGSESVSYIINDEHEAILDASNPDWKPSAELAQRAGMESENIEYQQDTSRVMIYEDGNGRQVLGIVAPVTPGTWSVVVEQSLNVAFGNVWINMVVLIVLIAVVGLLALGWGLFHAYKFLRPLNALREGALALGQGRLDHRIVVRSSDYEIQELAQTFNHMAVQLQASRSEIEEQNERLREGLQLARDIQMGLLPSTVPWSHECLLVNARSIPASEVGGDFYAYVALSSGKSAISVGDISGKGVGAALMMALTCSMIETQARASEQPSDVLCNLNRLLHPRLQSNKMNAAMLYAVFDIEQRCMKVANAGMISPLLIRRTRINGQTSSDTTCSCQFVDVGGLPIGSMSEVLYRSATISLEPGDTFLFMSDGIVEAHNAQGEMFGFERLDDVLVHTHELDNVYALVDTIVRTVQDFMGQADQHDDITIIAVRPVLTARK